MELSKYEKEEADFHCDSHIEAARENEVHGTAELQTEQMTLRRYCPEDAEALYRYLGTDSDLYKYSGWNPYATLEMALETVRRFMESYDDKHSYSWVTAWSAEENIGSRRVLEKAGMKYIRTDKNSLVVGSKTYDKRIYEYR